VRDIGIANGRIAAIGRLGNASAAEVVDCKGLHILPGVIDTQVHFREPGLTQKEDLETGSAQRRDGRRPPRCSRLPNTDPLTVTEQAFTDKVKRGPSSYALRFRLLHRAAPRENVQDLPELERAPGCAGGGEGVSSAPRPARFWWRTTRACGVSSR